MTRARQIAGVDEAGRGPLAGPVVAAAVILDPRRPVRGLADSKQLAPHVRELLAVRIRARAIAWSVAWADANEIDCLNILEATLLAMRRALLRLPIRPTEVLIDGNRLPRLADLGLEGEARAIVRGDQSEPAISAASILAKTWRDALMCRLHECSPVSMTQIVPSLRLTPALAALRPRIGATCFCECISVGRSSIRSRLR